jgi:hypothetical protein
MSAKLPNVRTEIIKDNAIDEDAIKIDSVTYEEISDSAVREIVKGVWNADVVTPIDVSEDGLGNYTFAGNTFHAANTGSMGHAILMDYLSGNMQQVSPLSDGKMTPAHLCSFDDATGTRFYSEVLDGITPLGDSEEAASYIDRTAVLIRGVHPEEGLLSTTTSALMVVVEHDNTGDGWNGNTLSIFNSDGVLVASETLESGYDGVDSFELNINEEYTWTFGGGGGGSAPEDARFWLANANTSEELWYHDFGTGEASGSFTIPMAGYQQFLVRISAVGSDANGGYFDIHQVDEDESVIPHGIQALVRDGAGNIITSGDMLIVKAETDPTMHEIAHEVWEEAVVDHSTPHTFGMFNRIMAGLTQYNHRITNPMYDQSGRLLSCRLKVYETADNAASDSDAIASIVVTSTYDEKQNMDSFSAVEEELPPEE